MKIPTLIAASSLSLVLALGAAACGGTTSSTASASSDEGALGATDVQDVQCTSAPVNGVPLLVTLASAPRGRFVLDIDRGTGDDRTPVIHTDSAKFKTSSRTFTATNESDMNFFSLTIAPGDDRAETFDGTMSILPGEELLHFEGKVTCVYTHP
jgi:hypothetical protein